MPCKMERYFFYLLYLLLGCSLCGCSRKQAPKQAQDPDTETTIPYADTIAAPVPPAPVKSRTARYLDSLGFVNIAEADSSIAIDLMYTRADNFTGTLLYEDLKEAYLHPDAMKEPFATYPNAVRSAAMYYSKDGQTRKLYVQFAGYREGDFIETYDFQTKEWRMFMFYVPFAEILLAR